ncbi:MAG: hypothetical protein U0736_16495 [Gemmataceae bacterium]
MAGLLALVMVVAAGVVSILPAQAPAAGDVISLAGEWQFRLDRGDAGIKEHRV